MAPDLKPRYRTPYPLGIEYQEYWQKLNMGVSKNQGPKYGAPMVGALYNDTHNKEPQFIDTAVPFSGVLKFAGPCCVANLVSPQALLAVLWLKYTL